MSARRHRRRSRQHAHHATNVTPLIDVVMVLIIFYLMVGSFIASDFVDLPLPFSVKGEVSESPEVFTVNLARVEGGDRVQIIVGGEECDLPQLERELREALAKDRKLGVQLRAQRDLPYRAVEPVVRAMGKAGAGMIRLVTERAS
ncbi:MAG: ExbD/TolR family protein [Phycisphaerales bacterium]